MSVSFREEDVDLSRLPEDSRDIESQAFVDAVFALYQEPYEGMEGSFSCSYTEGLFEISWIPLGDPGTELMQVRELLEDGLPDPRGHETADARSGLRAGDRGGVPGGGAVAWCWR